MRVVVSADAKCLQLNFHLNRTNGGRGFDISLDTDPVPYQSLCLLTLTSNRRNRNVKSRGNLAVPFRPMLCGAPSLSNAAKPRKRDLRVNRTVKSQPQDQQPLTISTTSASQPGGGTITTLTGRYQSGGKTVNLRSLTVKTEKITTIGPPPPDMPSEEEYQPDASYYYIDSEMVKSDGTVLAEAIYEYEQSTGRNNLNVTLDGVMLTFDFNTQEVNDISDADQQKLQEWAGSADAALVQDTSTSIINNGSQQSNPEFLLNYYAVGMFVDFTPPTASIQRSKTRRDALHHAVRSPNADNAAFLCGENGSQRTLTGTNSRHSSLLMGGHVQCFGCCGIRCACINDRSGNAIYGEPCKAHDACVGQYGYTSKNCRKLFVWAVIYTYWRILSF